MEVSFFNHPSSLLIGTTDQERDSPSPLTVGGGDRTFPCTVKIMDTCMLRLTYQVSVPGLLADPFLCKGYHVSTVSPQAKETSDKSRKKAPPLCISSKLAAELRSKEMSMLVQSICYFSLFVEMFEAVGPTYLWRTPGERGVLVFDLRERHELCAFDHGVGSSSMVDREKLKAM